MNELLKQAHRFSSKNRKSLEESNVCGCFYCLKIFSPALIEEWWDNEETAVCPHCGIDSVIGDSSDFHITKEFLQEMHEAWF
ncbi:MULTISPECIES: cytoplasmic protein [Sutcliffiella]|uniref:Cytoplasmic protein n=1 Tax=Sutcliffiella cohnii TaxID=33932 RepID=A0A223KKS6_9BACI|nr:MULTISPECIES: cytoplasmic protein [Sutcliffiella]AST89968.1 cytoplasmic protein [Sutcliffiella cohnii]MED4018322.1 cytoplasmic protein [Sutcliffiella cohnii]WBL15594.1 cytoplasmic protein [Sutcliffiella sp. NC1]